MDDLQEFNQGARLIELAKTSPEVPYDKQLKGLVKQLKEYFGDEPMCKLHE